MDDNKTQRLAAVLTPFFAIYFVGYIVWTLHQPLRFPFGDFFALWSYGRASLEHPAARLYDMIWLHGFQVTLGMPVADENPFPYPPTFIPLLACIGIFSFYRALLIWVGVTLTLYLLVVLMWVRRPILIGIALLAPTTTVAIIADRAGYFWRR